MTPYFKRLKRYDQYALMSAMRGPDDSASPNDVLKAIVTSRIRHIVFGRTWRDAPCMVDSRKLTTVNLTALRTECSPAACPTLGDHFMSHLEGAVRVTVKHPIWGGLGEKVIGALSGGIRED